MSPAAVEGRLEELRQLYRLALYLSEVKVPPSSRIGTKRRRE
jgi:hypothetical protein